jgi:hypothetical protein
MKRAVSKKVITPVAKPKLTRVKPPVAKVEEKTIVVKGDEIATMVKKEKETLPIVEEKVREEVVMEKLPKKEIEKIEYTPELELPVRLKLRYRKIGGSLTLLGKRYKVNDIIEVYPEQIPQAFMDTLVCLNSPEEQKRAIAESKGLSYFREFMYVVVPSILAGWYNVINTETKKQINEKQLSKADAERLCISLNI